MTLNIVFPLAGCLMRVSDAEVRQQIVESVKSFYSCVAPEELLDGTDRLSKPKPRTFHSDKRFSRLSLSEALSWLLWWHACAPGSYLSFQSFQIYFSSQFYTCFITFLGEF